MEAKHETQATSSGLPEQRLEDLDATKLDPYDEVVMARQVSISSHLFSPRTDNL